jgi:DNA invertase Pin-like site-specific DNA recombinase
LPGLPESAIAEPNTVPRMLAPREIPSDPKKRQYALRGRAIALGWRDEQIIVVDNDQSESGASAAWREGFQRLVSDVGMGGAGTPQQTHLF